MPSAPRPPRRPPRQAPRQPPSRRAVLGTAAAGAGALLTLGAAPYAYASTAPPGTPGHTGGRRLPFLIDMVQADPGEPMTESRYNDPRTLASYGYDGQVVNEFRPPHTGVTFDTVDDRIFPPGSEARAWVEENHLGAPRPQAHRPGTPRPKTPRPEAPRTAPRVRNRSHPRA
ncbi:hypothetical protein [Streptomyces sp. NBC_01089]|uniref:hypothetical protein n=1 Tax=Streptomyces sp. NBC_01089 TaxID=2903747 RepID=UPI00386B4B58|nr:hypothetical protein OG510_28740 [Streptomyces sp. NBC_01089]